MTDPVPFEIPTQPTPAEIDIPPGDAPEMDPGNAPQEMPDRQGDPVGDTGPATAPGSSA